MISTGLLALLALPKLSATANLPGNNSKAHLVTISSHIHEWVKLPQQEAPTLLAALNDKSQAVNAELYNTTKLLVLLLTRELAKLPAAQKVVVNTASPGICVSQLRRNMSWWAQW